MPLPCLHLPVSPPVHGTGSGVTATMLALPSTTTTSEDEKLLEYKVRCESVFESGVLGISDLYM